MQIINYSIKHYHRQTGCTVQCGTVPLLSLSLSPSLPKSTCSFISLLGDTILLCVTQFLGTLIQLLICFHLVLVKRHIRLPKLHVIVEHFMEPQLFLGLVPKDYVQRFQVQLQNSFVAQQTVQSAQKCSIAVQFEQGDIFHQKILVLKLAAGPTLHRCIRTGRANLAQMLGKPRGKETVKILLRQTIDAFTLNTFFNQLIIFTIIYKNL